MVAELVASENKVKVPVLVSVELIAEMIPVDAIDELLPDVKFTMLREADEKPLNARFAPEFMVKPPPRLSVVPAVPDVRLKVAAPPVLAPPLVVILVPTITVPIDTLAFMVGCWL